MMDCIMFAVLAGCIGSIILLIGWCQKQVDKIGNCETDLQA